MVDLLASRASERLDCVAREMGVPERLSALPERRRRAHQGQLDRLLSACGCTAGAIGALGFAVVAGVWLGANLSGWKLLLVPAAVLVAFVGGGFVGKVAGLAVVGMRFKSRCRRIVREARRAASAQ